MSDFHGRILNLRANESELRNDSPPMILAYKTGHRDARHGAAEIALEADAQLEAAAGQRAQVTNFCANCEATERRIAELKAEVDARVDDEIDLNTETERAEAWRKYAEKMEKELRAELQTAQADAAALREAVGEWLSYEYELVAVFMQGLNEIKSGRKPSDESERQMARSSKHAGELRGKIEILLASPNPGAPLLAELAAARTQFATLHAAVQRVIFTLNSRDEDAAALERALTALEQVADLNKGSN